MANYLGIPDQIIQAAPYTPDFNFLGNVLQIKQTKYDAAHKQVSQLYGTMLNSPLTRTNNINRRTDYFKQIDGQIKQLTGLDLSLKQNQDYADQIFTGLTDDKNILKDMTWTKGWMNEQERGENLRTCVDPEKCGGRYWEGGMKALQYKRLEFMNATPDEAMRMDIPKFVAAPDFDKVFKHLKEAGIGIKWDHANGGFIYTDENGERMIPQLKNYLLSTYGDNQQVQDYFATQMYVKRKEFVLNNANRLGGEDAATLEFVKQVYQPIVDYNKREREEAEKQLGHVTVLKTALKNKVTTDGYLNDEMETYANQFNNLEQATDVTQKATKFHEGNDDILHTINLNMGNVKAAGDYIDRFLGNNYLSLSMGEMAKEYSMLTAKHTMKQMHEHGGGSGMTLAEKMEYESFKEQLKEKYWGDTHGKGSNLDQKEQSSLEDLRKLKHSIFESPVHKSIQKPIMEGPMYNLIPGVVPFKVINHWLTGNEKVDEVNSVFNQKYGGSLKKYQVGGSTDSGGFIHQVMNLSEGNLMNNLNSLVQSSPTPSAFKSLESDKGAGSNEQDNLALQDNVGMWDVMNKKTIALNKQYITKFVESMSNSYISKTGNDRETLLATLHGVFSDYGINVDALLGNPADKSDTRDKASIMSEELDKINKLDKNDLKSLFKGITTNIDPNKPGLSNSLNQNWVQPFWESTANDRVDAIRSQKFMDSFVKNMTSESQKVVDVLKTKYNADSDFGTSKSSLLQFMKDYSDKGFISGDNPNTIENVVSAWAEKAVKTNPKYWESITPKVEVTPHYSAGIGSYIPNVIPSNQTPLQTAYEFALKNYSKLQEDFINNYGENANSYRKIAVTPGKKSNAVTGGTYEYNYGVSKADWNDPTKIQNNFQLKHELQKFNAYGDKSIATFGDASEVPEKDDPIAREFAGWMQKVMEQSQAVAGEKNGIKELLGAGFDHAPSGKYRIQSMAGYDPDWYATSFTIPETFAIKMADNYKGKDNPNKAKWLNAAGKQVTLFMPIEGHPNSQVSYEQSMLENNEQIVIDEHTGGGKAIIQKHKDGTTWVNLDIYTPNEKGGMDTISKVTSHSPITDLEAPTMINLMSDYLRDVEIENHRLKGHLKQLYGKRDINPILDKLGFKQVNK